MGSRHHAIETARRPSSGERRSTSQPNALQSLIDDVDPLVRFVAAVHVAATDLAPFLDDPETFIRELASSRLVAVSLRHVNRVMGELSSIPTAGCHQTKDAVQ